MKKLFTLALCLPLFAFAQTSHTVMVFGGGSGNPAPAYSPQNLTIDVGDTVKWNNTQGSHNVFGMQSTFPNNPVGFSSGSPASAPWMFEFVFTVAGVYDYHCTQGNHAATQFGSITVVNTQSVNDVTAANGIKVFPNPASNELFLDLEGAQVTNANIYSIDGREISGINELSSNSTLNVSGLNNGHYVIRLVLQDGTIKQQRFVVKK